MFPVLAAFTTFISTGLGGLFALRYQRYLRQILGFTAGVLLGVVAFDILPEIFKLLKENNGDPIGPMIALVAGFLIFHTVEKLVLSHHAHEEPHAHGQRRKVGILSAVALSGHSFLDGVGIGLAFQVNTQIGLTVALAVVAHDFSDGLNTVSLMMANGNSRGRAMVMLLVDALAPVLGALSTLLFTFPEKYLVLYLGFFAGFLLYIGASSVLPEAHREHTSRVAVGLTICGAVFIYLITRYTF